MLDLSINEKEDLEERGDLKDALGRRLLEKGSRQIRYGKDTIHTRIRNMERW